MSVGTLGALCSVSWCPGPIGLQPGRTHLKVERGGWHGGVLLPVVVWCWL